MIHFNNIITQLYTERVSGSSPLPPTRQTCGKPLFPDFSEDSALRPAWACVSGVYPACIRRTSPKHRNAKAALNLRDRSLGAANRHYGHPSARKVPTRMQIVSGALSISHQSHCNLKQISLIFELSNNWQFRV